MLLAAIASVATSQPTWNVGDATKSRVVSLTESSPEASYHYTVNYDGGTASHRVEGTVLWEAPDSSAAKVQLSLIPDDGRETVSELATLTVDANGSPEPFEFELQVRGDCGDDCTEGYMVQFERIEGDGKPVVVNWTFRSTMTGVETQPKDAQVEIVED